MSGKDTRRPVFHYRESKPFTKFDILSAIILIIVLAVSILLISIRKEGSVAEIYYKGDLIGVYKLDTDREIPLDIEGKNTVAINGGKIRMSYADCENELCVKTNPIMYQGQRIVCAPHSIIIIIRGESSLDGITGGV